MSTFSDSEEIFGKLASAASVYRVKLADALVHPAAEILRQHEAMAEVMRPHLEEARRIAQFPRDTWSPRLRAELETARGVAQQFQDAFQALRLPKFQFPELKISQDFSKLAAAFDSDRFNKRLDAAITNLAAHGWVISVWETPIQMVVGTSDLFDQADSAADEILADHFREIGAKILNSVSRAYPDRAKILATAFAAHERGEYELSIPVMLAQADGIGANLFGVSPYTQQAQDVQRIAQRLQALAIQAEGTRSHWLLVATLLPINASRAKRAQFGTAMNRNTIMHGESVDYASELNSLKSIAWLGYISSFKEELGNP